MKKFLILSAILLSASLASADCVLQKEKDGQKLFKCQAPGLNKSVFVLDLKGDFASTAYYHGYFLRPEIETGVLKGVMVRAERAFSQLEKKERARIELIKKCVLDNYKYSVSSDFKKGLKNLHRGLRDAGSKIGWEDFENANYMVEFSIFADSMQRQLAEDPSKAKVKVFASCAPYFVGSALLSPFKKLAEGLRSIKMGCTGISASATSSSEGALVHGRNFDSGLIGFYEPNQVIVINRQKNGTVSTGIASAGLHYAGGISGFNNHGLAVSLHELQTEGTQIRHEPGSSDIAPYLLHSVLMQATSIDEAVRILKQRKGFGAWTFFISDARHDESASVELSGDQVHVARQAAHKYLGQSNHFIHPKTSAEGYEYSLNKTLETRARLAHVNRTLGEDFGKINPQWVINRLTGHTDELVGMRSFGRTTTKLYTSATHVMIPARQEWWMSTGDVYPTNRSHFVGYRLTNGPVPVEIIGVTKAAEQAGLENWYDSMKYYVLAYKANEEDHTTINGLDRTLSLLEQGMATAKLDNVYEYPYHFMWARLKVARAALALEKGQKELALIDLEDAQYKFVEIESQPTITLHEYERFQLAMWKFRAESLMPSSRRDGAVLKQAQTQAQGLLGSLIRQYPRQSELKDLQRGLNQADQLSIVRNAEIRLGTVE